MWRWDDGDGDERWRLPVVARAVTNLESTSLPIPNVNTLTFSAKAFASSRHRSDSSTSPSVKTNNCLMWKPVKPWDWWMMKVMVMTRCNADAKGDGIDVMGWY